VPGASWISYAFDLKEVMSCVPRKCAVVWRHELYLGVRFVDQAAWPETKRPVAAKPFGRRGAG
jgi:hypothetical protein